MSKKRGTHRAVCDTCPKALTKFTTEEDAKAAKKEHLQEPGKGAHKVVIEVRT